MRPNLAIGDKYDGGIVTEIIQIQGRWFARLEYKAKTDDFVLKRTVPIISERIPVSRFAVQQRGRKPTV